MRLGSNLHMACKIAPSTVVMLMAWRKATNPQFLPIDLLAVARERPVIIVRRFRCVPSTKDRT